MYKRSAVKYIVIIKQYLVFTLCTSVDSHVRPPLQAKTQYLFIDIIIRYRNIEVVHLKSPIQDKLLQGHLHAAIVPSYLYHRKIYIFQLICMFYKNTLFRLCLTTRILLFRHFSSSLYSWSSLVDSVLWQWSFVICATVNDSGISSNNNCFAYKHYEWVAFPSYFI